MGQNSQKLNKHRAAQLGAHRAKQDFSHPEVLGKQTGSSAQWWKDPGKLPWLSSTAF